MTRCVFLRIAFCIIPLLTFVLNPAIVPGDQPTSEPSVSQASSGEPSAGYNEPWPEGRGFHVGDTVPDIPLYDMQNNEVRFSKFLGKRYILYCWASW